MIRRLKPKDKFNFFDYCLKQDDKDFYIIKNQDKLFLNNIKNCKKTFSDILKKGDICYIFEERDRINGIFIISKDASQRYLRISANNKKILYYLFRVLNWNWNKELFLRVTKNNFIGFIAKKNKFLFIKSYDDDVLLCRNNKKRGMK